MISFFYLTEQIYGLSEEEGMFGHCSSAHSSGLVFLQTCLILHLSVWFSQEQKHLEKLNFEKELEEKQREQTQLLLLNNSRKEGMLLSVKLVPVFTL